MKDREYIEEIIDPVTGEVLTLRATSEAELFTHNVLDAAGRRRSEADRYLSEMRPDSNEAADFQFSTSTFQRTPAFAYNQFKAGRVAIWGVTADGEEWNPLSGGESDQELPNS